MLLPCGCETLGGLSPTPLPEDAGAWAWGVPPAACPLLLLVLGVDVAVAAPGVWGPDDEELMLPPHVFAPEGMLEDGVTGLLPDVGHWGVPGPPAPAPDGVPGLGMWLRGCVGSPAMPVMPLIGLGLFIGFWSMLLGRGGKDDKKSGVCRE